MLALRFAKHCNYSIHALYNFRLIESAFYRARKCKCFSTSVFSSLGHSQKKDLSGPYPLAYYPEEVEKDWYTYWENSGFFQSKDDKHQPVFSLLLPPPNITGRLHLGHTLTVVIQDTLCRWHRMNGKNVLWIPGYDHGGIATQAIVEKKLLKEKELSRHQLGRDSFLDEVMQWRFSTEATIESQLKRIGSSLDFTRSTFTMDSHSSDAVIKTFIQLFDENLIYRKEKMVNWSCSIRSVISDIEVDNLEIPGGSKLRIPGLSNPIDVGYMEYFYYPVGDSDQKLLIGTTRLETMLGDTAVAVNPYDSRYTEMIGRFVTHPFTGALLPIIADEMIDKSFGTGAMKVTPAHDFKDFELGLKHDLELKEVFTDEGTVKNDVEIFGGMHRFEAREKVRQHLLEKGLYLERKDHPMSLPVCSRTGDIVEPRLKQQWYLSCSKMAEEAVKAVEDGRLKLSPEYHRKLWFEWFNRLQDWCISRQLWWGHRLPVYRVSHPSLNQNEDFWVAAKNNVEAIDKAARKLNVSSDTVSVDQDTDVLDTWFSSALFPLTALRWSTHVSEDIERFYPFTLMETGYDILFFWVARMVMLCNHLSGKLPFNQVLLHGMMCDSHGRKMTKSLGNVVDPFDIIHGASLDTLCKRTEDSYKQGSLSPEEMKLALSSYRSTYPAGIPECGADALRFSLLTHDVTSQRISMDVKEIRISRHFCNKIWQGVRLFTKTIENCKDVKCLVLFTPEDINLKEMNEVDQWILSRLSRLVSNANRGFEEFDFHFTSLAIRLFWVQNFCDIYLEYVKPSLVTADEAYYLFVCRLMLTCIETFLKTLSPVMPFLSEELYQRLSHLTNIKPLATVTTAPYPQTAEYASWRNTVLEADMNTVIELVNICRSLKTQHGASKIRPKVTIAVESEDTLTALNKFAPLIAILAKLESVVFHITQGREFFEHHVQDSWVFREAEHGITVIMEMDHSAVSSQSCLKRISHVREELQKLSKMMSDAGYRKKAPLSVQEKHLAKKASLEADLLKLSAQYSKGEADSGSTRTDSRN